MIRWKLEAKRPRSGHGLCCVMVVAGMTTAILPLQADASPHLLENGGFQEPGRGGSGEAGVLNVRMFELEQKRNYIEAIPVAERYAELIKTSEGARHPTYIATLNHLAVLYRLTQRDADAVAAHHRALGVLEELGAVEPDNAQWQRELAKCHIALAKAGDDPERNYRDALTTLKRLQAAGRFEPWDNRWVAVVESNLRKLAIDRLFETSKFEEALTLVEQEAQSKATEQAAGQGSVRATAEGLDSVARYALFARRPDRALTVSERAIALTPNLVWLTINRAHALLYLSRFDEALAAYKEHQGESMYAKGDWETLIARDFREFRAHDLDHPQMRDVERALQIGPQRMATSQISRTAPCVQSSSDPLGAARCDVEGAKSQYGEKHAEYARALVRLAARLDERKQSNEAAPLYKQSIEIFSRTLTPDHPYVGQLLLRLDDRASKDRGLHILDTALKTETLARQIDPDDAYVGGAMQELADQSIKQGHPAEAARALKILNQRDSLPSPKGAAMTKETANGSLARIEMFYAKSLGDDPFADLIAAPGGSIYKSHYAYYSAVTSYYEKQGDSAALSANRNQFIALSERMLHEVEPNKLEKAEILAGLAELYEAAQRPGDAEDALRRAMTIRMSLQGPSDPDVMRLQARLVKFNKK
jgi:hypothetical protein